MKVKEKLTNPELRYIDAGKIDDPEGAALVYLK